MIRLPTASYRLCQHKPQPVYYLEKLPYTIWYRPVRHTSAQGNSILSGPRPRSTKPVRIDRDRRIEKLSSRRKCGGLVRPTGDFHTAVSLSQIRQQDNKARKAAEIKMMKSQLREGRRIVRLEVERLKQMWRDDQVERLATGQKRIALKSWL